MRARRTSLGHDYAHNWSVDHPSVRGGVRRRVLVEASDGAEAFARVRLLERNGYDAAWCPGPPEAIGSRCPLVAGEECPLTDWADVVVTSLGIDHPAGREVLEALRRCHPDTPVIVEAGRTAREQWPHILEGHRVLSAPTTADDLLDAVGELAHHPRPAQY